MQFNEVVLTDTARSKCFRMLSSSRIKKIVNQRADDAEKRDVYRLYESYTDRNGNHEDVVILFEIQGDKAVVITQKHKYHENS